MKYITEERFIVSSNTKEAQKNYRDNWDRIFGEEEPEPDVTEEAARKQVQVLCTQEGWNGTFPIDKDSDAIEIRVRTPQWFYDRLNVGWPCPCCGWGNTIDAVDFEALVFECIPNEPCGSAQGRITHKFTDIPRDAK